MSEPVAAEELLAVEERLIDRGAADLEIGEHLGAREVQANSSCQSPYIQTLGVVLLLVVTCSVCAGWVMGGSPQTRSPHQIELRAAQAELLVHRASKREKEEVEETCHTAEPGESCYSLVRWSMKVGIREHPTWYHSGLTEDSSFEEVQAALALAQSSGCPDPCGSIRLHYDRNAVRSHRTTEEDVEKVMQKKAQEDIEKSQLSNNTTGHRVSTTPRLWTGPGGRPLTATEANEMEAELNYQGYTNPLNDSAVVTTKPTDVAAATTTPQQWRGPGGRPLTATEVNEMEAELNYQGYTNPLNNSAPVTTTAHDGENAKTTASQWRGPGGRPLTATEINEMEAELNYQGYTNPLNDSAVVATTTNDSLAVTTTAYQWRGPGGRPLTATEVNEMEAELNYQGYTNPLNGSIPVTTTAYQWHGPGGRPLTATEVNEMEAELNYQGYTNPLNDSNSTKAAATFENSTALQQIDS